MGDVRLTGGCQCRAVRYTVSAPARETAHCHCGMCRKAHGALFATFSTYPSEAFHIDAGAESLACYDSSPGNHRYFCGSCGCPIYVAMAGTPEVVYLAAGTLDGGAHPGHPEGRARHIFVGSKVGWYEIADDLPQAEEY